MLRMGQEPEQAMTQLFWGSRDREIFTELGSLGHGKDFRMRRSHMSCALSGAGADGDAPVVAEAEGWPK